MAMHRAVDRGAAPGLRVWQGLSALLLLVMAGIHLYLVVFAGFGGLLGTLFVLNGIGGLVLAIAMVVARRGFLALVSVLSLLFLGGTLLSLVIALTPGASSGSTSRSAASSCRPHWWSSRSALSSCW